MINAADIFCKTKGSSAGQPGGKGKEGLYFFLKKQDAFVN
jgi:hypothetical protein